MSFHETSPILPQGETLRKAVRMVHELGLAWNLHTVELVSQQYDLSPMEEEFLINQFVNKKGIGG